MRRILILVISALILTSSGACAKSKPPKHEFRAAWVATVANLDWPGGPYQSSAANISDLIFLLDQLKNAGINAVIFQIRPECDALYNSTLEPWSYWLTGKQGQAPEPFFDPLTIAVREAHKRGMELHAWFNPYRAERSVGDYPTSPNHVTKRHPDWVIQINKLKFLDPGLPMVREYVTGVIMDVVRRYDIDGVHFDDYFYPYPSNGITNEDDATFANYSRGFSNRGDWRRDNVNLLIEMVYDSIKTVKPYVKFGVSPFGIWKNGVPSGIVGLDAYNTIYCDAVTWLNKKIVDYLTPQLYWPFGGGQDYGKLMPWWASRTNGRHLYPGQAPYRINANNWAANELPRQIQLNRNTAHSLGSVFFRAFHVVSNPKGFTDSLQANYYRHPALSPVMNWEETEPPETPANLRYQIIADRGSYGLEWDAPVVAVDGDSAFRYVVYRFNNPSVQAEDIDNAENMVALVGITNSAPKNPLARGPYYYGVTALDRNSNESNLSGLITLNAPAPPVLALPVDGANDVPATDTLTWLPTPEATAYNVQVATDSLFRGNFTLLKNGIQDTFVVVSDQKGWQTYFWRVSASSLGGSSEFSAGRKFTTGFPALPVLASPTNNQTETPIRPTLIWFKTPGAKYYQLQVAFSPRFNAAAVVLDSTGIQDTTLTLNQLESNKSYYWRLKAVNDLGISNWTATFRFVTEEVQVFVENYDLPAKYELSQNYPNPFRLNRGSMHTTIQYQLANQKELPVQIIVYNLMGQKIRTILQTSQSAGVYQASWDGRDERGRLVGAGIYIYRISAGAFHKTQKMIVIR